MVPQTGVKPNIFYGKCLKMEKKLFITDFDGTLLTDDKMISAADLKTLDALQREKIYTVIATGRSIYSFKKALTEMGRLKGEHRLPVDYVIFSTGAGILDFVGDKVIRQKALPLSDIQKITTYLDHRKFDYMVHKSIPGTRYFLYQSHGNHNPDFQARIDLYKAYASPLAAGQALYQQATEVLVILPGGADREFLETIRRDLSGFSVIQATSPLDHQSAWIEIFHRDVSKARSASWLAGELGVDRQNIVSVGNDYNDQDLLAWSGKGFVVENAPESLKQLFKTVSSNNQSGVSRATKSAGWMDWK